MKVSNKKKNKLSGLNQESQLKLNLMTLTLLFTIKNAKLLR